MTGTAPLRPKPANAIRIFLRRWRRTSWPNRALLCEAMALLVIARIAILVLPFRTIGAIAARMRTVHVPTDAARAVIVGRIRWAILACAKRAPFRAVCFQQGLAAQIMLHRRGVSSTLYFGAAPDDIRGLVAHVWVRDGDTEIVGCEEAPRFAVLARFPDNSAVHHGSMTH